MRSFYFFSILLFFSCAVKAQPSQPLIAKADTFYAKQDWRAAAKAYENAFANGETQTALTCNKLGFSYFNLGQYGLAIKNLELSLTKNPLPSGLSIIHSRLARAYAANSEKDKALEQLDSAIAHGYSNVPEIETSKEYDKIRNDTTFKNLVSQATDKLYPCLHNAHAREFDFWIGDWDVYPTGGNQIVGSSKIEMEASGCFILENWTAIGYPNTGKSMNFVDPVTNKWKQVWVGSGGAVTEYVNGVYKDSVMQFESSSATPKGTMKIRFRFFNQGTDQVRQFQEYSMDDGKTWNVSYDLTYIRKKK
ncbi:tetratricopeptide repeat protein [Ginsengibacter hankyongi]|uniref:Tetratricopeptide repeat protein n=1 Tax=Ginsengibacter hankyongi TaxID=2607284 RepID=A0A5J5IIY0_9BACT|nr:tetratricopeptide repeat protein [Ginsengibacter hankyongi]KAA9040751.1 tetratricopeptide repeat protein [Ginsengibacter hankyongi]